MTEGLQKSLFSLDNFNKDSVKKEDLEDKNQKFSTANRIKEEKLENNFDSFTLETTQAWVNLLSNAIKDLKLIKTTPPQMELL